MGSEIRVMVKANCAVIPLGTAVLFYNQWTNYENQDIRRYFRRATGEEIRSLKSGDVIWIDEDPIHPNGKVYGFVKRKVARVDGNRIYFGDGFTTQHNAIFIVDDESVLARLIAADSRITDVIGESGRMASRLLGL